MSLESASRRPESVFLNERSHITIVVGLSMLSVYSNITGIRPGIRTTETITSFQFDGLSSYPKRLIRVRRTASRWLFVWVCAQKSLGAITRIVFC